MLGKMISPQSMLMGAAAVDLAGNRSGPFRKVLGCGLVPALPMSVLAYLQSTAVPG